MYKKIILFILALLSCNALFSQFNAYQPIGPAPKTDKPFRVAAGIKGGVGLAIPTDPNFADGTVLKFKSGMAGQFGAVANIHLGRRTTSSPGGTGWVGLQAEALYGFRRIGVEHDILKMHCIEIPLMFQVYPINTLAIEAGATFTKTIKCTPEQMQSNGIVFNSGQLSSSDVMLSLGIAYKVIPELIVDLRYNYGRSPLAGNFDSKVSTFNISAEYFFDF